MDLDVDYDFYFKKDEWSEKEIAKDICSSTANTIDPVIRINRLEC